MDLTHRELLQFKQYSTSAQEREERKPGGAKFWRVPDGKGLDRDKKCAYYKEVIK